MMQRSKARSETVQEVANVLKVSRRTVFRGLKDARDHDALLGGAQ